MAGLQSLRHATRYSVRLRLQLLCAALFLVFASCHRTLGEYGYKVWTVENGLPQNEVRGITQTPDGYLWVVTLDGLARFDGVRFTIFNKSNSPGILSNRLTSIEQGYDGDLWMTYDSGGLLRFHRGTFRTFTARDGIPGNVVSGITADSDGGVWIVSRGLISKWNEVNNRFELVTELNKRTYGPLVWDSTGFGAFDKDRIYCFSKGQLRTYLLPEHLQGREIRGIALTFDQVAWVKMASGELARLALGDPSRSHELPKDAKLRYRGVNGQTWEMQPTAEMFGSISFATAGETMSIEFRHGLVDRQGNLWLATEGHGLYRLRESPVTAYTVEQGLLDRDVYPIYQDRSGAVWVGTWHKGLSRFQNGQFRNFTVADGLPNPLILALLEDRDGRLWIATDGGVTTYRNGHFDQTGVPPLSDEVHAIYQDHNGTLWFGMRSGIGEWKNGSLGVLMAADGSAPFDVHVIAETPQGDLWFGGADGLMQLHDGHSIHWSESNGLSSNDIWSLYPDADGTLWIGTFDGGLMRLKDGHITRYTTRNGLYNDGVFQILDDRNGNLWISCDMGIYRISKKELLEIANGTRSFISSVAYGREDGLLDLEANGGIMPAGTRTSDGRLWFPTQDGIAVIDPRKISNSSETPKVVIESATVDQVPIAFNAGIRVPPTKYNLQIQYTAPDFNKPEQIRFRYRLDGLDEGWIEAGALRSASYTHLPPGHYTFLVSATNGNGVWSQNANGVSIDVLAPFYRTLWFEACVLLVIASIAFGIWRYRLMQLRWQQALQLDFLQQLITSQENERKRIAGELHDSLGQRLVIINGMAKLALRSRRNPTMQDEENVLAEISQEALAAIQDTRSISYNLRPVHLDRLGLTRVIEHLVKKASEASSIPMVSELDDIDDLLPEEQRINLYRIVQEAISNLVKYSHATAAGVRIRRKDQLTVLTIYDNGVGFVANGNLNKTGRIGMGLRGMAERASLIGGNYKVASTPGGGTVVSIEISVASPQVQGLKRKRQVILREH